MAIEGFIKTLKQKICSRMEQCKPMKYCIKRFWVQININNFIAKCLKKYYYNQPLSMLEICAYFLKIII